MKMRRR